MDWNIIHHLKNINKKLPVVVIDGFINTHHDCSELAYRFHTFSACKDPKFVLFSPFGEREPSNLEETSGIEYLYIDKTALLCPDGTLNSCVIEANDKPAFYDSHHISLGFVSYIGERIVDVYSADLNRFGFPAPILPD